MSPPASSKKSVRPDDSPRRVLTREQAIALGHKLIDHILPRYPALDRIWLTHTAFSVTKVANGSVLEANDGDRVLIMVGSEYGSRLPVWITTNQLDDGALRKAIDQALNMLPPLPNITIIAPRSEDDESAFVTTPREFLPISLWHDSTARAMETARGDTIPRIIEDLHAAKLNGAATVGMTQRVALYMYPAGLTAFAEETDCEVTVTARTPDGLAAGWGGQAHRDWSKVAPSAAVAQAVDIANRSHNPVAFEPGRRTAILGPAAVAQLVYQMGELFDGEGARGGGSPFSVVNHNADGSGRRSKVGMRVFDPRIMMRSDPADPDGGYAPFFEDGSIEPTSGYPTSAVTWVDRGVLTSLAYNLMNGMKYRLPACDVPRSMHVSPAPGTQTATIEEMIAHCEHGIYVNRFSELTMLDRGSGMMTGSTRDGCFLVRNGKIDKPIKNFRFIDSPFFAFNKLQMIGVPARVPFGYVPSSPFGFESRWPRSPIIVPPMMVTDFNFSALADAV